MTYQEALYLGKRMLAPLSYTKEEISSFRITRKEALNALKKARQRGGFLWITGDMAISLLENASSCKDKGVSC